MTEERRDNVYGRTISEWIALVPGELPRDAVGLWQILAAGQHSFELVGAELIDYVRRNVAVLLDAGAIPVAGGRGTNYDWVAKTNYGSRRDEIIDAVIKEWQATTGDEMYPWSLWFALPRDNAAYIKM